MSESKLSEGQLKVGATGFLSLFAIVGISFYGLPFFFDFWVDDFGWSRTTITSGNAVGKLVIALFAFVSGWVIDRFGPRRVMLFGIVLGGVALVGLGNMTWLWQFYFFYFVSSMAYMTAGPLPNQVLISRWFVTSRGKAMGFAYIGIGVGGMFVPQIARLLNVNFGWHTSLMLLGLLMVVVAFPMIWFVKDNPEIVNVTSRSDEPKIPFMEVLKRRNVYLLLIGSMCSIGAVAGTSQHLKLFLSTDLGFSQEIAANMFSMILGSSIIGRILMGWLSDKFPKKYVMILIYSLVAGSIPLLYFASGSPALLYVFGFVFGVGLGGDYMIIPLMAAELFGVKILGRIMGVIITADVLGEAFAPVLVGYIRDQSGSYTNGFTALIILAVIGTISISLLPKRPVS
ncbi:MFS transporter [Prolixibacteraceae bacterium Z1-6]|uniref:MFS transporter n=1 Tax=Draconibacterium aestuarii TaxID=2998507 RepID=A0A9X3FGI0_9BACT|nr:MFS transporter [Prolixibacteraceae bacterium Z1-6]